MTKEDLDLEYQAIMMMSVEEIGRMKSANTEGRTTVDAWANRLPADDRRAGRVRGYIDRHGEVPGFLTVTPSHSMLVDGHHRYKEARDAGLTHMPVLDDPEDPRFNW